MALLLIVAGYWGAAHPGYWHEINEAFLQSVGFPPGISYRPRTIRAWSRFNLAVGLVLMAIVAGRVFFSSNTLFR
jgi:hypothetical protein